MKDKVDSAIIAKYNDIIEQRGKTMTESSISRIYRKIEAENVGMISASRSNLSESENANRSRQLQSTLVGDGFDVTRISGNYIEQYGTPDAVTVKEVSFFVAENEKTKGKLLDALVREGKKYDQDSIFFKPNGSEGFLLGTSTRSSAFPPLGERVSVGTPKFGDIGEFFSTVKNRPFTFESAEEAEAPSGFFGKWGASLANKKGL